MSEALPDGSGSQPPVMTVKTIIGWLMQIFIVLMIPFLLVTGSARLIMTPYFLPLEYTRAGFPEDSYGFTIEDRLKYGPYGILYILNNEPIEYLTDIRLEGAKCYPPQGNPCAAFTARELGHMEDVQRVAQAIFSYGLLAGFAFISIAIVLWRFFTIRLLRLAMMQGSLLTLGLILTIILLAITAWNTFFSSFHSLFFEEGSWQFFFSDTLIRLYPQQFWFDASLLLGGLTVLGAIVILVASFRLSSAK